jgi:predicted HicB family RNase H-like nuclease
MSILKAGRPSNKTEKAIAAVSNEAQDTIRMNVNISKSLHKKMKQKALDSDTTITELVIQALNDHLSK